jgi:large subunit ribosomal protein L31e
LIYYRFKICIQLSTCAPFVHRSVEARGEMTKADRKPKVDLVSRDYTINLKRRVGKVSFKKRAPRAIKEIRAFAQLVMKTKDVRLDQKLNKYVWSFGIKNIPTRVRVRLSRKRNEDEEAEEKLFTLAQLVEVSSYKGLQTENVEAE